MAATARTRLTAFFRKVFAFSVEDLFSRKRPPGPPRTVFVNENLPEDYVDHKGRIKREHLYTTNQVITSKYTIITFVPRNLLEQFRRVANIYFLAIAILQFFPKFSTISPGVVILPLVIIIALTALKDAYEDFRRHQSDRRVNQSKVKVLAGSEWTNPNGMQGKSKTFVRGLIPKRGKKKLIHPSEVKPDAEGAMAHPEEHANAADPDIEFDESTNRRFSLRRHNTSSAHWKNTMWEDLRVGDFVKITEDQPIPADVLICATSDEENVAFVETKNLDGETNLKSRNAVPALTHLRTAADCANTANAFHIRSDRPETNLYRLNASLEMGAVQSPIDIQTTLLRGTVLRNTEWVIGVVLFTGEDTKIVLNAGGTPSKRSRVERQMDPTVLVNLALIAIMAVVCAIVDSSLEKVFYPEGAPWLYGDNQSDDNPNINGVITWAFALLTFQDIVPISLYLSIEVVRTLQSAFIYFDKDICYDKTGQAAQARTYNLSDDLGQIEYIFSDKTGTLTQNSMVFRQCSIGGKAYRGDPEALADGDEDYYNETPKPSDSIDLEKERARVTTEFINSDATSSTKVGFDTPKTKSITPKFRDAVLAADIAKATIVEPNIDDSAHARALNGFFTVLGLCHTVLTSVDPVTGVIEYKAQSPDEAALVQAAADVGYVFLGRDKEMLSLHTPFSTEPEKYELLNVLDFTSARKRMSVILRKLDDDDRRLFLLSKGADNVIFERLRAGADDLKAETEQHLSEFANEGLRTLTLAFKVISEEEYEAWSRRYHEASVSLEDREGQIEIVSDEIERDLRLLGASAIEDRLQDGVPEAIADLKKAGIKIWVATGDKLETAIAIGRSTNLIGQDSNIVIVRGSSRPVDEQMRNAIEKFFPEHAGEEVEAQPRSSISSRALRRVSTGASSIVGDENGNRPGGYILVVDGAALLHAFENEDNKSLLLRLGTLCEGVICCRVSPLQKALVVKLVKDGLKAMTLAIGDGANDVSMIQAADVGVGISGEEGLQAVNSSDYAIAQFRFLKKLILVHGHWSYARNGTMIMNFFYKNIVPTGILWWFQIYCGWSGAFAFDYTYLLFWNSLWTIAPVVGVGLFDRILDSHILMDLPQLYHFGRERYWFSYRDFFLFSLDGIYQSVIIFFFIMFGYRTVSARTDGYDVDQFEWSTVTAVSGVMVADIFTGLSASAWTWWLVFAVFIGIALVWAFTLVYSALLPSFEVTNLYGFYYFLCASAYFWFGLLLTFCVALAPRFLAKAFKASFAPDDLDIVRAIRKENPYFDFANSSQFHMDIGLNEMRQRKRTSHMAEPVSSRRSSRSSMVIERPRASIDVRVASRTDMSTGLVSVDRGFDHDMEENGVAMRRIQTNLSERYASSHNLAIDGEQKKGKKVFNSLKRGFTRKSRKTEH